MEMEKDKIVFKGSHPDSLYRVATGSSAGAGKITRALRVLRWPVALIAVCVALAVFVYFLMPDNLESRSDNENGTYWESVAAAGHRSPSAPSREVHNKKPDILKEHGTKTSEIDFYADENTKKYDLTSVLDSVAETFSKRKLPVPPVFPTHLTPEVQYGNEKADKENTRMPKLLDDVDGGDSTLKPHITQKPEKPLAVYFKDASDATTSITETITRAETINDFTNYDHKLTTIKKIEETPKTKTYTPVYKEHTRKEYNPYIDKNYKGIEIPLEVQEFYSRQPGNVDVNFTSGHSKLFGISIEDAEKMKSTTQSSLYNTRVSPTLPTWRDGDDTTTKKYTTNIYSEVQCRSTRLSLCRGVLPYDLAGAPAKLGALDSTALISQFDYLVATNCSERVRHFVCALLEPECSPPPFPAKMPCYNLCKVVMDSCEGHIPTELLPAFNCKQYSQDNCLPAKSPCYTREFGCSDGTCIPREWLCDGTKNCPNGEDEAQCVQCDQTEYRCASGGCILKRWLCDGYMDCPDGEDEHEVNCGSRDVHEVDTHEPGEDAAGSAPAPAIKRPNRVPIGRKGSHRVTVTGENESSKELLVTSDSNNALKRNFTRRPLPTRLTPYRRRATTQAVPEYSKEDTTEPTRIKATKKLHSKKPEGDKTTPKTVDNESIEDVNMGDLGFFEEFEKEGKESHNPGDKKGSQPMKQTFGVPEPSTAMLLPSTQTTRFDKNASKLDRVIDGAALLKKAAQEQAADADDGLADLNSTYIDDPPLEGTDAGPSNVRTWGGKSSTVGTGTGAKPANAKPDDKGRPTPPVARKQDFGEPNIQEWSRARTAPCPSGELRCVDGRCITLAQLCDGTIDCSDHADEDNCYT